MTIAVEDMVAREVHYCVSSLVATVAEGTNYMLERRGEPATELAYQALELTAPIEDWEEAAREAGWEQHPAHSGAWSRNDGCGPNGEVDMIGATTARDACDQDNLDPYQREVYEHWIVSDWLADKLAARGEKVDKDFAGMTVWARTTTGQAISLDGVIQAIWADMIRPDNG